MSVRGRPQGAALPFRSGLCRQPPRLRGAVRTLSPPAAFPRPPFHVTMRPGEPSVAFGCMLTIRSRLHLAAPVGPHR